jgi:FkbM family methyltransferase
VFIWDFFGGKPNGFYVDVGANHPFRLSNTFLLYERGWRGITIEPIPHLAAKHRRTRPRDIQVNCGVGRDPGVMRFYEMYPKVLSTFDAQTAQNLAAMGQAYVRRVREVEVTTLGAICRAHVPERTVDLLSVDVEGFDLAAMEGWDWSWCQPRVIVCEMYGMGEARSDAASLHSLFTARGYERAHMLGCNAFYVRGSGGMPA